METIHVEPGSATVRMNAGPQTGNIFGSTHGGAIFSLIDEAFQLACNSHGVLSVALNVSITYVAPPGQGALLEARATELCQTSRTSSYLCEVRESPSGKLIATAQALAYRTKKPIEFETD
jgi:acyl-CoA thioesterase